jgi:PAS domain S-box-containing protein
MKWYEGLYEKIPCTCLVVEPTGVILDANRFAREFLGYSAVELVGHLIVSIFSPEDQQRLQKALTLDEQSLGIEVTGEFRLVTKKGETRRVKVTFDALKPVGNFPVLLLICEECTPSPRLEESVQDIQSQVQLLMDAFPGKVSYVDALMRYQLVSKRYEEWSLICASDVIGKAISSFMSPQQYQEIEKYVALALAGQSVRYEFETVFNDGKRRYLLVDHVPHISNSGVVLGFFVFCQEFTERKKAEEALRQFNKELNNRVRQRTAELELALLERQQALEVLGQAEAEVRNALAREKELSELRSQFIALVSHEFRTPLTTIGSSNQLLERYDERLSSEKKRNHYKRIQSAIERMSQLLDEVLLIGQAEAGKLTFEPALIDVVALCRDLVETLTLSLENHTITFLCQDESYSTQMDEKLLGHILTNLLSNAIKYSPSGGEIQFSLVCTQTDVVFQITDRGIGIPTEDLDQLYESFGRASNVGTIQGTGLGLAIAKKSVDLHGGTIAVESEVGVGTTFTVTLPLTTD